MNGLGSGLGSKLRTDDEACCFAPAWRTCLVKLLLMVPLLRTGCGKIDNLFLLLLEVPKQDLANRVQYRLFATAAASHLATAS